VQDSGITVLGGIGEYISGIFMKLIDDANKFIAKLINLEFNRFIIVGVVNTLLSYIIYVFLVYFLSYPVAYTMAYISGIFISYCLNSTFVFKREIRLIKALQYPVVYLVQYVLGMLLLYFLVEACNINQLIAPIIVVLVTVPITFILSRFIIKGRLGSS